MCAKRFTVHPSQQNAATDPKGPGNETTGPDCCGAGRWSQEGRKRNGAMVAAPGVQQPKPMRQSMRAYGFVTRLDGTCKASQSTDTRQAPSMRVFVESQ